MCDVAFNFQHNFVAFIVFIRFDFIFVVFFSSFLSLSSFTSHNFRFLSAFVIRAVQNAYIAIFQNVECVCVCVWLFPLNILKNVKRKIYISYWIVSRVCLYQFVPFMPNQNTWIRSSNIPYHPYDAYVAVYCVLCVCIVNSTHCEKCSD